MGLISRISNAVQSLRSISNVILNDVDYLDDDVNSLFNDNESDDYYFEKKKEKSSLKKIISKRSSRQDLKEIPNESQQSVLMVDGTTLNSSDAPISWEEQRQQWLTPNIPKSSIAKRKTANSLSKLTAPNLTGQSESENDIYLAVYKNLVICGRSLKNGINMKDGFKVINAGWTHSKMFERVANGGVP